MNNLPFVMSIADGATGMMMRRSVQHFLQEQTRSPAGASTMSSVCSSHVHLDAAYAPPLEARHGP